MGRVTLIGCFDGKFNELTVPLASGEAEAKGVGKFIILYRELAPLCDDGDALFTERDGALDLFLGDLVFLEIELGGLDWSFNPRRPRDHTPNVHTPLPDTDLKMKSVYGKFLVLIHVIGDRKSVV